MQLVGTRSLRCRIESWVGDGRLVWVGALAALASAGTVAIIHAVASALDAMPQSVIVPGPGGEGPLTLGLAMAAATLAETAATLVFGFLSRFSP